MRCLPVSLQRFNRGGMTSATSGMSPVAIGIANESGTLQRVEQREG